MSDQPAIPSTPGLRNMQHHFLLAFELPGCGLPAAFRLCVLACAPGGS